MREVRLRSHSSRLSLLLALVFVQSWLFACDAYASPLQRSDDTTLVPRDNNPLNIDWDPAPAPEDGPPLSYWALRDPAYLPAQIGGIVGSYALSLVLVAALLLILSKNRREALQNGDDEVDFADLKPKPKLTFDKPVTSPRSIPRSPVRNFSYPGSPDKTDVHSYVVPSPTSTLTAPGVDFSVDQRVVAADRDMAQQQLEEMYKYVMEQEEAKANGITLEGPPAPLANQQLPPTAADKTATLTKKEKNKPAQLNLSGQADKEKSHSRASSILSALRSPRKRGIKGISISSPIMTPMSGTFPQPEAREMNTIPPRQYAPPPPPPVPTNQVPFGAVRNHGNMTPVSPEYSPESTQSIDERMASRPGSQGGHSRNPSHAPTIDDPISAATDGSQTPLIGLPTSPKPGVNRFPSLPLSPKPSLPSSPKPDATFTFSRSNVPSAVRTGGALPLRAYEPALTSPSTSSQQTKQTVFERMGPLSPMSARTPYTGTAVPYSPYQPFTPCVPITPSLVTKADRKRMRKLEPKTPTLEMVRSDEDVW
jgi:hypothetical protein